MNWKKKLTKDQPVNKDAIFWKIYTSNMQDVYGKKPTDISARARAMYDLWCDTVGGVDKKAADSLDKYEAYLNNQKLLVRD